MDNSLEEKNELEFNRKKSQNGIAYKNNNDRTKVIRIGIPAYQTFSNLSKTNNKTYKEMFEKILMYYIENSEL